MFHLYKTCIMSYAQNQLLFIIIEILYSLSLLIKGL